MSVNNSVKIVKWLEKNVTNGTATSLSALASEMTQSLGFKVSPQSVKTHLNAAGITIKRTRVAASSAKVAELQDTVAAFRSALVVILDAAVEIDRGVLIDLNADTDCPALAAVLNGYIDIDDAAEEDDVDDESYASDEHDDDEDDDAYEDDEYEDDEDYDDEEDDEDYDGN